MNAPARVRLRLSRAGARALAILIAALLLRPAPGAQPEWDLLAQMPADADVVVLIDDLSGALRSRAGRALHAAIDEAGLFAQTLSRARELADTLRLSPDETVDALLGERLILVARASDRLEPDGQRAPPDWTLATTISAKMRQRVVDRLAAAPRDKIDGQLVLSIEHGRFLLTMVEDRDNRGRERTTLVLAPEESAPLFADLVRRRVAGPKARIVGVLGESDEFAIARDLPAGNVLAFMRTRPVPEGQVVLAASANRADNGWLVNLAIQAPGWAPDEAMPAFDPLVVGQMEEGALALVMESLPGRPHQSKGANAAIWPTVIALPGELAGLLDGRAMARVTQDPGGKGLCLTIASDLSPEPGSPARVDHAVASMIAPDSQDTDAAFDGEFPQAVRTAVVSMGIDTPIGRESLAAWAFATGDGDDAGLPTWWALQFSPDPGPLTDDASRRVRSTVSTLGASRDRPGEEGVCAAGLVRPGALLDAIGDAPWADNPTARAMRWFDQIRWRLAERRHGAGPGRCGITDGWVEVRMIDRPVDDAETPGPGAP